MTPKTKAAIEEAADANANGHNHKCAYARHQGFIAGMKEAIEHPERYGLTSLRLDETWPLKDILAKLSEAAEALLIEYSYDALHYEEINSANNEAKKILEELK